MRPAILYAALVLTLAASGAPSVRMLRRVVAGPTVRRARRRMRVF